MSASATQGGHNEVSTALAHVATFASRQACEVPSQSASLLGQVPVKFQVNTSKSQASKTQVPK